MRVFAAIILAAHVASAAPLFRKALPIDVGYTFAFTPGALVVADFNNDGFPDLATSHESAKLVIVLSDGVGPFAAPLVTTVPLVQGMAAADVDGDGDQDLLTVSAGTLHVLLGHGDGTFTTSATSVPTAFNGVLAADVNGDGKVDAVGYTTSNFDSFGKVAVHLGDGHGNFAAAVETTIGPGMYHATAADFNLDGKDDLLVETSYGIKVYLAGNGGVLQNVFGGGVGNGVVVGKFNADGIPDFGIASQSSGGWQVFMYLGNGDGTFTVGGIFQVAIGTDALVCADLDGDGLNDIVGTGSAITYLRGLGTGSFEAARLTAGGGGGALAVRDFDRDGILDLVTEKTAFPSGIPQFLKGNGDGTFREDRAFLTGSLEGGVAIDMNADGKPDAVTMTSGPNLAVFRNDGFGGLLAPSYTPLPASASFFIAGRVNDDSAPDAVVFGVDAGVPTATVLFGSASGALTPGPVTTLASLAGKPQLADVTGDSIADLVIDRWLYAGNGDGTFEEGRDAGVVFQLLGDFDRNGTLDVMWRDAATQRTAVSLNSGSAVFAPPAYFVTHNEALATLGDFDGDGILDAVTASEEGIRTYIGRGDGTFREPVFFGGVGIPFHGFQTADFDGDGNLDLLEDGTILFGNGDGRFRGADGDKLRGSTAVADFDGNGTLDLVTISDGNIIVTLSGLVSEPVRGSSITLASSMPDAEYPKPITLSGSIDGGGSPPETGWVIYWDGDVPLGVGEVRLGLPSAVASLSRALPVGANELHAVYSGDQTYLPSTSATLSQFVDRGTTKLEATGGSSLYGEEALVRTSFLAGTVTYLPGPTGDLTVEEDGTTLTDVTWHDTGTGTTAGVLGLVAGSHALTVSYPGDGNYKPSSATATATVAKRTPPIHTSILPDERPLAGPVTVSVTFDNAPFLYGSTTGSVTINIEGRPPAAVPISGNQASTTATLEAGTYDLVLDYSGDANNLATSSSRRLVVYAGAWGTVPVAVSAVVRNGLVDVKWTPLTNVSAYRLYRRPSFASAWLLRGATTATRVADSIPAGTTWMWAVVPMSSTFVDGPLSAPDIATNIPFTDDPIAVGTIIKAAHVTELRDAVNSVRTFAGLSPFTFTDAALQGLAIKAVHINELRTALSEARSAIAMPVTFAESVSVNGIMRASHLEELRDGVR